MSHKAIEVEMKGVLVIYDAFKAKMFRYEFVKCFKTDKNYSLRAKDGKVYYCHVGQSYYASADYAMCMDLENETIVTAVLEMMSKNEERQRSEMNNLQRQVDMRESALADINRRRSSLVDLIESVNTAQ